MFSLIIASFAFTHFAVIMKYYIFSISSMSIAWHIKHWRKNFKNPAWGWKLWDMSYIWICIFLCVFICVCICICLKCICALKLQRIATSASLPQMHCNAQVARAMHWSTPPSIISIQRSTPPSQSSSRSAGFPPHQQFQQSDLFQPVDQFLTYFATQAAKFLGKSAIKCNWAKFTTLEFHVQWTLP